MSESQVALAVLNRALDDARGVIPDMSHGRPIRQSVIEEGRAFWESDAPEWREAREAWCDAAGVHPEKARAFALREIAKAAAEPAKQARESRSEMVRQDFARGVHVLALAEKYSMSRSGIYKALASRRSRWA